MKYLNIVLISLMATSSLARADTGTFETGGSQNTWTWACSSPYPGYRIEIAYLNNQVVSESIHQYRLVEGGRQLPDESIGHSVFDVKIGSLRRSENKIQFKTSLQDYSDIQTWAVTLTKYNGVPAALVTSTFQSSDGDGKVHRSTSIYTCNVAYGLAR